MKRDHRIISAFVAVAIGFVTFQSLACFTVPGARPTSVVSELALPERPDQPAVIYTAGNYAFYMQPGDIIEAMKGRASLYGAGNFSDRLQSLLPLAADIHTNEILEALAPEYPDEKEITQKTLEYRRFWQQSHRKLEYAVAALLEQGLASVTNVSTGRTLVSLTRNNYNEICFGGRKFIAEGKVILQTDDWIS